MTRAELIKLAMSELGKVRSPAKKAAAVKRWEGRKLAPEELRRRATARQKEYRARKRYRCVFIVSTEPDCCYQCGKSRGAHEVA